MLYITGDTHGETSRIQLIDNHHVLMPEDYLLVAGDFGFIYTAGRDDEEKLDILAQMPFTILFVDGNHECFPALRIYPVEEWNGGKIQRIRPNVLHLMRGQVFTIGGKTIFTMGGGYTLDGWHRVPGIDWWPQDELPTGAEYAEARENLARHGNRVDYIVSHTGPDKTMDFLIQRYGLGSRVFEEMPLNLFLQEVCDTVSYGHYYFGHMHLDQELWRNQTALMYRLYRMDDHQLIDLDGLPEFE